MQRLAEKDLEIWWKRKKRKPLLLRGARQVGKSTLIRTFAKNNKIQLIEVNLEKRKLRSVSAEAKSVDIDIKKILNEIESHYEVKISKNIILFFDEIQAQPQMIPILRYFYEELPDLPILAAGSLLEFVLEQHQFQMPVGRIEYLHLGPMTFEEYLIARKKTNLLNQIKASNFHLESFQYDELTNNLKEFLFVGGMPEAVAEFIETNSFSEVTRIHRSIFETYHDDFPKYAKSTQLNKIQKIFERIPAFIGKKLKYSEFYPDLQSREIKHYLHLLSLARVIHFCYHSNCSGLPLSSQKDEKIFKLYFLDVGLLNHIMGIKWDMIENFTDKEFLTRGNIAEQFVAQHLAYQNEKSPELYYWLKDKSSEKAEVDFVIEANGKIIPVEVKAGKSGWLHSLKQFHLEKKNQDALRFFLNPDAATTERVIQPGVEYRLTNCHLALAGIRA
jgi:predicted AAA+ superfamily ATPase